MPDMILAVNAPIVIASFAVYTLAIVAIGLYSARFAKQSDEDYFLAGRSLSGPIAALSASASSESGWVTLGLVGIGFGAGVQGYWVIPGCLLGYLFNWFVLARRMSEQARDLNALTVPDYLAYRFKEQVPFIRMTAVLIILAAMMAYVAAQMAAAGKAFGVLFDEMNLGVGGEAWGYRGGVLVGAAIVLIYTITGGFRAVCWTDFLQALLMAAALVLFPLYLLITHGGYAYVFDQLQSIADPEKGLPAGYLLDPWASKAGWALLGFLFGSHALGINFGYPGMPHVLVRFMALRDKKEIRLAGVMAFVWGLLVYWGAVTVGLFARAMNEAGEEWTEIIKSDQELSLVVSSMHLLPDVISGLILAAILAAICSTADSQLVVAASSAAHDLYARLFKRSTQSAHLLVNRAAVFVLGAGAVLLVIDQKVKVYQYVLQYGWAMLGAAFGPQVILALLWKRATYAGCLTGMIVGFVATILWHKFYDAAATGVEIYNLPVAFAAALLVNVVVSLATYKEKES